MKSMCTILFLLAIGPIVSAQTDDLARKGNEAYAQEKYSLAVEYYIEALENQPSTAIYLNLGHAYVKLEQWSAALQSYESALAQKDPEIAPAEIYGYLGQTEYMSRNYTQALHHLTQAKPGKPPGTYNLLIARCLIDLQRFHLAESEIIEFLKLNPDDIPAGELLAHIYMQTDQADRAADTYQGLLRQRPTEIRYYKALAQAQVAAGQYSHAIDTLEMARRISGPGESNLDRLLADLYIQETMYLEAASCYSRIVHHADKPNVEDIFRLGHCYYQSRQWLSARQAFTKVLQQDPTHARSALYLGHIAAKKGEIKSALEAYTQSAQLDTEWPEPYFSLAELQLKQNHFPQAAESFHKALSRHEFDAKDYYRYLLILQQAGDKDQFKNILTKAISKYPQDNLLNQLLEQLEARSISP
jgi:tetratricopeptide (TPR) repeat protein